MAASSSAAASSATASRCTPGGPVLVSSEDGRQIDEGRYYYGNGSASYRPTDHRTITLSGTLAHTDFTQTRPSLLTAAAIPGGSADLLSTNEANFNYRDLGLDYRGTTARQGEMLTASVKWARFSGDFDRMFSSDPVGGPANLFQQQQTMSDENWTGKVDYVRPFGGANRLSVGAQLVTTSNRLAPDRDRHPAERRALRRQLAGRRLLVRICGLRHLPVRACRLHHHARPQAGGPRI